MYLNLVWKVRNADFEPSLQEAINKILLSWNIPKFWNCQKIPQFLTTLYKISCKILQNLPECLVIFLSIFLLKQNQASIFFKSHRKTKQVMLTPQFSRNSSSASLQKTIQWCRDPANKANNRASKKFIFPPSNLS